jgi:hypothetical protein
MIDEAITSLRQRMIDDMMIHTIASKTQQKATNDFEFERVQLAVRGSS